MKLTNRCDRCGTKRFKKKTDGTLVCKNGHLRLGWQEETQEEGMVFMGKRRKVVSQHDHTSNAQERFTGADRECVRLQICQKGLNNLVEHCARELRFPDQIQKIAMYLWILYVSKSDKSMEFDIFDMDREHEYDTQSTMFSTQMTVEEELNIDMNVSDDEHEQPEDDDTQEDEKETAAWPELRYSDIVVFLFLTFKMAGLPVLVSDIRRWCKSQEIPYSKSLLDIPKPVLRRVDRAFIYATQRLPSVHTLCQRARLYRRAFEKLCQVPFSNANIPSVLHRIYPHFGLPEQFRGHAAAFLDKMLEFTQGDKSTIFGKYDGVQAVVCMVVLVKFLYTLDDKPQGARNSNGKYDLPPPPPKQETMKALQAEVKRLRILKQKSDLAQIDTSQSARLLFLRDFGEVLKGAGYTSGDIVRVGDESQLPLQPSRLQYDVLYLLADKHPDPKPAVEKSLARRQIQSCNTMYTFAPIRVRNKHASLSALPKEFQTLMDLAACLIDMDARKLYRALTRFEQYIKDDYLH